MQPQYPQYGYQGRYSGQYTQQGQYNPNPNQPNPNQKKKLPFHLIQSPVSLKPQETDIHVANFDSKIAIINFWLDAKHDIIFSLFLNARETEHPTKKCTQKLKSLPPNTFEKHFKISASNDDPKENFNVYLEAPIDLEKLSEVEKYESGTVLDSERYQVIVRLVRKFNFRNQLILITDLLDFIIFQFLIEMKMDIINQILLNKKLK